VGGLLYYVLLRISPGRGVVPGDELAPGAPRTLGMAE
jgi:hypothetical protein